MAALSKSLEDLLSIVEDENPKHVGLIMDGNGRWAAARGLSRSEGHAAGLESFRRILNSSRDLGVPIMTVYAFSTENWARPSHEVSAIMELFVDYLQKYRHEFLEQDCRFVVSGRREALNPQIQQLISLAESETKNCKARLLNLAVSYGGREELIDAVQAIARQVKKGEIEPESIDAVAISEQLYSGYLPDPDLIIRTSGEHRLSGFLLWQSAYSELIFEETFWPDFTPEIFKTCLDRYKRRERRFGKVLDIT